MSTVSLDEDSVDEVLYLARANEASELSAFLDALSAQTQHPKAELLAAAVDPYTKNTALHYAAANGHNGKRLPSSSPSPTSIATFQMYGLAADCRYGRHYQASAFLTHGQCYGVGGCIGAYQCDQRCGQHRPPLGGAERALGWREVACAVWRGRYYHQQGRPRRRV